MVLHDNKEYEIAHMGEKRCACSVLGVKHEEKRQLQDLGVDGRIILQWICRNNMLGTDWIYWTPGRLLST
jgi:hypothetical protein